MTTIETVSMAGDVEVYDPEHASRSGHYEVDVPRDIAAGNAVDYIAAMLLFRKAMRPGEGDPEWDSLICTAEPEWFVDGEQVYVVREGLSGFIEFIHMKVENGRTSFVICNDDDDCESNLGKVMLTKTAP